jgi:hypothetical protein
MFRSRLKFSWTVPLLLVVYLSLLNMMNQSATQMLGLVLVGLGYILYLSSWPQQLHTV